MKRKLLENFPRTKIPIEADRFRFILDITAVKRRDGEIRIEGNVSELKFMHGISLMLGDMVQAKVQRVLEGEWPYLKGVEYRVWLSQEGSDELFDWEIGHVGDDRLVAVLAIIDFCADQGFVKKDIVKILGEAQTMVRDAF
ncbi:MAG: hypothetical protein Q7J68_03860 [Thermoplasmata archaeon]|nr:hypothetical protein [Thermoplasmata archaeon]